MKKFLISIIAKDQNFSISNNSIQDFLSKYDNSRVIETGDNTENITIVNNRMIETALSDGYDYLIMLHSDVEIDLIKLCNHIEECENKYDVMGLCGCEKISISESPLNWFCGSRNYPQYRWGCVCHGELGNSISFFSSDRADILDHQVSCIDGLCIILSRKSMLTGLRFDEKLKFNCYDTQISFDAQLTYGLKVGCLVEKELKHFSVGKSILEDSFFDEELILRQRFDFEIPKNSKMEKYLTTKNKIV
jgi:hypothetical protein